MRGARRLRGVGVTTHTDSDIWVTGIGLVSGAGDLATFVTEYVTPAASRDGAAACDRPVGSVLLGCDFGSTTAKAVVLR